MTIVTDEILKRAPIENRKTPFQQVATTVFPSVRVPASLLSISVPSKPSLETTDYIIPRVDIKGPYFSMLYVVDIHIRSLQIIVLVCIRLVIYILWALVSYLL